MPKTVIDLINLTSQYKSRQVYKEIGERHFIDDNDIKFILNNQIAEEFQRCLTVAIKAFLAFLLKDIEVDRLTTNSILEYLMSSPDLNLMLKDIEVDNLTENPLLEYFISPLVCEEISHLLDPGSEYFDREKLTQDFYSKFSEHFENLEPQLIFDAWEEFLKAFFFASRSATHLREFLRASDEVDNFRALSNIEDVLQKMELAVSEIQIQEQSTRQSMTDYMGELKMYKHWAANFSNELRT